MELFLQFLLNPGTQNIWFPGRDPGLGKETFLDQQLDPAVRFQVCVVRETSRQTEGREKKKRHECETSECDDAGNWDSVRK